MIRSSKITFEILSNSEVFEQGGILAKKLWNHARWYSFGRNEEARKEANNPSLLLYKYPGGFTLQKELKDFWAAKNLSDRCFSYTLKDFDIAVKSWFSNLKSNPDAKPPKYTKYPRILNFEVGRNAKWVGEWTLRLTVLGGHIENRHCFIKLNIRPGIKMTDIKLLRLQPNYSGVVTYSIEQKNVSGNIVAGIDLGIINLAVVAFSDGTSILYSGKGLNSKLQWQHKLNSFCKPKKWEKGKETTRQSENFKKTLKKAGNIQKLAIHNLTTSIVKECVRKGVYKIIIGDLKGIRNGKDLGKQTNQKLHNWPFAEIRRQIEYKSEEEGIKVIAVNERGTSSHCCFCGEKATRNPRGLVSCKKCNMVINSDLNGAFNILNKVSPLEGVEAILPSLPSPLLKNGNRQSSQIDPVFTAKFDLRNWSIEQTFCNTISSVFNL